MNAKTLSIRPYEPRTDLEPLVEIWHAASRQAHSFLGGERLTEHRDLIETIWLPAADTYVAEIDGTPVGFVSLLGEFVGGLFVDPPHHGQGIGRQLLAHAQSLRGALELDVYEENTRARAFYEAVGFITTGRKECDAEGLPHPILRMRRAG